MSNIELSDAQKKAIALIEQNQPVGFLPWGLNYGRLIKVPSGEHIPKGRIRYCTWDALKRKRVLMHDENGTYVSEGVTQ